MRFRALLSRGHDERHPAVISYGSHGAEVLQGAAGSCRHNWVMLGNVDQGQKVSGAFQTSSKVAVSRTELPQSTLVVPKTPQHIVEAPSQCIAGLKSVGAFSGG